MSKSFPKLFVIWLALVLQVQAASVSEAAQLAKQIASAQELPQVVQLRFQVMAAQMGQFEGKKAPENLLTYFSETRNLFWSRPVQGSTEQSMRSFEQQMVALAAQKGRPLDLPPVGYAPSVATTPAAPVGKVMVRERVSADVLSNAVLQAERAATDELATRSSAELLFLRDNMTRLREDLADGNVAVGSVRGVLGARARFLTSPDAVGIGDQFWLPLNDLAEVLRANFPAQRLRQAGSGSLTP